MKRFTFIQLGTCFLIFILVLTVASPVFAQEGDTPQIVLSVFEASPGATIEITGGHFEPDVLITFILLQNGNQIQIGTFFANWHGDFTTAILLPHDLQPGQYEFHAVDERNRSAVTLLAIVPDPGGQENAELRDEDDSLLAPMPTFAPGVIPGQPLQSTNQASPSSTNSLASSTIMLAVFGLLVVVVVVAFGLTKLKRT